MARATTTRPSLKELLSEEQNELHALSGELPIEDVSADGGGQLSEVGPPYDGTGGVVRGIERELQWDHPGPLHRARSRLTGFLRKRG